MAKYIDVKAFISFECSSCDGSCNKFEGCENCEKDCRCDFIKDLAEFTAADVAKVRHGHWIADREDVEWGNTLIRYRCSECRERPHFDKEKHKFILSLYCPNCGARMDERSEDDV